MNINKNKAMAIPVTVMIYYLLAFGGFSLLRHFGIFYNGSKIHIYAIPMMLVISFYVYSINGKCIFKKEDFFARKEDFFLYLIPYIAVSAALFSILEAILTKHSVADILCMAVLTFFIGISEEGMFRLFILKDGEGSLKKKVFLYLFSTFAFAALHMMNIGGGLSFQDAFLQSINAIPFGLVAGFLFLRTGNISSLVFWHMFFDFDLFAERQGVYIVNTILGIAVDLIMIYALVRAIIQIVVEHRKKRR